MKHLLSPSILSADFGHLADEIKILNDSNADCLHLDIMDGVYVPNISFGFPVIKYIAKVASKPLDAHLMIVDPDRYIEDFAKLGIKFLTVHYETCVHLHRTIKHIHESGMTAGVALNPATPVSVLEDIITDVDLVLIMSVDPGFGGQKFITNTYDKVRRLRTLMDEKHTSAIIQVDGGVNLENASELYDAGVDCLVVGYAIFGAENPSQVIADLKRI